MNEIIWLILVPIFTAFSLLIINLYFERILQGVIISSGVFIFILSCSLLHKVLIKPVVYSLGSWEVTKGINLIADPLAGLLVFIIGLLNLLIIIYSLGYINRDTSKYYTLLFVLTAALNGMVLTGDLFNLFVCVEIVSIVSYALVAFRRTKAAYEASFKYIIIGTLGSFFVLLAIILTYHQTGTLNLAQLVSKSQNIAVITKTAIISLFLIGFGSKFALVPLHTWLPDAHPAAPSSISALLSGIVIKGYLYAWLRTLLVLSNPSEIISSNLNLILIYCGVVTLLGGHLLAFQQQNLKRLLAYSSISQIGYIMIGIATFTNKGMSGAVFHIINHAVVKSALFLAAGIFSEKLKAKQIKNLVGAGYKAPLVSFSFTVAAVTIIGLPPFNIFISKWLIALSAIKTGFIIPAGTILLGSILALTYYLKVIKAIYTKEKNEHQILGIKWQLKFPVIILAVLCLGMGLFPNMIVPKLNQAVIYLLDSTQYYQILFSG